MEHIDAICDAANFSFVQLRGSHVPLHFVSPSTRVAEQLSISLHSEGIICTHPFFTCVVNSVYYFCSVESAMKSKTVKLYTGAPFQHMRGVGKTAHSGANCQPLANFSYVIH